MKVPAVRIRSSTLSVLVDPLAPEDTERPPERAFRFASYDCAHATRHADLPLHIVARKFGDVGPSGMPPVLNRPVRGSVPSLEESGAGVVVDGRGDAVVAGGAIGSAACTAGACCSNGKRVVGVDER